MRFLWPALLAVAACAQTVPEPLKVVRVYNLVNGTVIDNRSAATRQSNYSSYCATGKGTWAVVMQYSDTSSSGPWTSFGPTAEVTDLSMTCVGHGLGYHHWIRFSITGTATANYSGSKDYWIGAVAGGEGGGESTTASNVGTAGVGVYDTRVEADLQFRKLNPASARVSIALDSDNRKVDFDVVEAELAHQSIGGAGTNTHSQIDTHLSATAVHGATSENTASRIVARDASGNFVAGTVTATVTGNASTASALAADPADCSTNTFANAINAAGTLTCTAVANAATTATSANTPSTIVARDASGDFAAATVTANLSGNASGSAASITGNLTGDVTSVAMATTVATVGGATAANVADAASKRHSQDTDAGTSSATFQIGTGGPKLKNNSGTIESRNAADSDYAPIRGSTLTGNLTGNVTGNVSGTAASITGNLTGDVTSVAMATTVATVGGATAANVADAATKRHTQGTDQGLDTGGANAVTAAQTKTAYTHSQVVTGNPHVVTTADIGAAASGANSDITSLTGLTGEFGLATKAFADLGTPADGRLYNCSDCQQTNPCAAGGSGAVARRENSTWNCGAGAGGTSHAILSSTHTDATPDTVQRGDLITGQGVTPAWNRLTKGGAGACLVSDGLDINWGSCSSGPGIPGGSPTQMQFNDNGVLGGTSGLTWDKINEVLGLTKKLQLQPSANQPIASAGTAVLCNAATVQVTPSSSLTLTSVPTIATGYDGQLCSIINLSSTNTLTLQDESVLTGSNLRLGGINRTIYQRGAIVLQYNSGVGDWVMLADQYICAFPDQTGHAGKIPTTDGSTVTWTAHLTLPPSAVQTIDEVGDSITAGALNVRINPDNNYTLTSTPTIADGADGQLLLISNNSPDYSVTLQDEDILENSNLRLGGSNVAIGPRGSLLLSYDTALASWIRADTPGSGGEGGGITTSILTFPGGNCQMGVASTNFALPTANYPMAYCLSSGSTNKGLLAFSDAATDETVQWDIVLPPDWNSTPGIKLNVRWTQSGTAAGNARWGIYGACTADGEAINNPTFSSVLAWTDAAKEAAWQNNDTAQQTLTTGDVLAGCAAGETLHLKFARTSSHADDTLNSATAYLDKLRLTIARTP